MAYQCDKLDLPRALREKGVPKFPQQKIKKFISSLFTLCNSSKLQVYFHYLDYSPAIKVMNYTGTPVFTHPHTKIMYLLNYKKRIYLMMLHYCHNCKYLFHFICSLHNNAKFLRKILKIINSILL